MYPYVYTGMEKFRRENSVMILQEINDSNGDNDGEYQYDENIIIVIKMWPISY